MRLHSLRILWPTGPMKGRNYPKLCRLPGKEHLPWIFEGMDKHAMTHMLPTEPLVAAHLHPRLSATSYRPPTLPYKAHCVQSTMTERAYKAAALMVKPLNVTSMLTAYQVELFDDMIYLPNISMWDERTKIHGCWRVQRCVVLSDGGSAYGGPIGLFHMHTEWFALWA